MPENILELENLSISNSEGQILDGLNFNLDAGERVSICGESGSGKSTLSLALLGSIAPGLSLESGSLKLFGKTILAHKKILSYQELRPVRAQIARLNQDPARSLTPTMRIKHLLQEQLAFQGKVANPPKLITEILAGFNLPSTPEFMNRFPAELSGGQRRRLAMAALLLKKPRLLILDEPSAGLDKESCEHSLALIKEVISELNCALILICHYDFSATYLATKHYRLKSGKLAQTTYPQYLSSPSAPPAIPSTAINDRYNAKRKTVLEVKNLVASSPHSEIACVRDLSFTLHAKEALALEGPSGAGKTTVARTILGLWPRLAGEIYLNQQFLPPALHKWPDFLRGKIGYVPQDPTSSFNPKLKLKQAFKNVLGASLKQNQIQSLGEKYIRLLALPNDWAERYPRELSGGQIQRLAILRALLGGAEVLILDEVTANLDAQNKELVLQLLLNIKQNLPLLVISHEQDFLSKVCDYSLSLKSSQLLVV